MVLSWFGVAAGVVLAIWSLLVQWLGLLATYGLVQDRLAASGYAALCRRDLHRHSVFAPLAAMAGDPARHHSLAWWRDAWPDAVNQWLALGMSPAGIAIGASAPRAAAARAVTTAGSAAQLALRGGADAHHHRIAHLLCRPDDPVVRAVADRIDRDERGDAVPCCGRRNAELRQRIPRCACRFCHFAAGELDAEQSAALARLEQSYDRLWVVPNYLPPDQLAGNARYACRTFC